MRAARVLFAAVALVVAATPWASAQSELSVGLYHPETLRTVGGAEPGRQVLLLGKVTVVSEVTGVQATLRLPAGTQFAGQLRAPLDTRIEFSVDGRVFSRKPAAGVRAVRFTLAHCLPGVPYPVGFAVQVSHAR